jgi:glycosyltransferase involved in cell wall biosynthesis
MRKKIFCRGPFLQNAGYGVQARFALKSLRSREDIFDIFLQNINWGKTGQLIDNTEETAYIKHLIRKTQQYINAAGGKPQFDMSLQVTIPNEFEKMAPINIGYTAGIETTKIAPQWIEKSALMDRLIVVSNHAKFGFENTIYQAQHPQTGEVVNVKNLTPVHVANYPFWHIEPDPNFKLNLETDFNFLMVNQWSVRKNIEFAIKGFLDEFSDDENVGLVLKLSTAKSNVTDRNLTKRRIKDLLTAFKPNRKCKVYLLHGNMTEAELRALYHNEKIKALVSTAHGEGFGLALQEAAGCGMPVITPNWSGPIDFLYAPVKQKDGKTKNKALFTKINYDIKPVQKEAVWDGVLVPDSQWAFPTLASYQNCLREVYEKYDMKKSMAVKLQKHILESFTEEKQYANFVEGVLPGLEIEASEFEDLVIYS